MEAAIAGINRRFDNLSVVLSKNGVGNKWQGFTLKDRNSVQPSRATYMNSKLDTI
ncbi:MAG: hypothetical protein ABIO31_01135 [Candidatus Nitrotoga sp.]